jgi:UV DNA damage endonuclease
VRIGYPGRNLTLDLPAPPSMRPETYDPGAFVGIVHANLDAIETTLRWNIARGIRYWRLSPYTIPLATHPVVDVDWRAAFASRLAEIGQLVKVEGLRLTVHPGQYIRLTAAASEVVRQGVAELARHAELFDLMGLDASHKVQIHTGTHAGHIEGAIDRFAAAWDALPEHVRARLAIENDERQFSLADNLAVHARTGVPLVFDTFHHSLYNNGESLEEALDRVLPTWRGNGPAMIDYSTQDPRKNAGAHAASIDPDDFARMYPLLAGRDVDVILEIKDKERSALVAIAIARGEQGSAYANP